ncbi:MAG TPA: FtsW/RodA/SpoVE family cell cycle protein [Candidatus Limnocylindrales bacterium]|nr:FtsW/RodA/SpoVE family cell cycle protein [Candidatus Limnocylindrales bacterium]
MTAATASGLPAILGPIRPRARGRESKLLALVAITILVGSVSLELAPRVADPGESTGLSLANPLHVAIYLGLIGLAHLVLILSGRRMDQVLLPATAMLGGISLLLMERLPQTLVAQDVGPWKLGLGDVQLAWLVLSFSLATALAVTVRNDRWLRLYKYTWAAAGVALLVATYFLGDEINGQRLSLSLGPLSGQPAELLKVILVVFLAGYLSEYRPLLVEESTKVGPISLPPLPFLAPMVAMWAIALGLVVVQRDLGAALLFFTVFLFLLYAATGRPGYVIVGVILFLAGSFVMYNLVGTVQTRVDIWLDPFKSPTGDGYQIVQSLYAFGRGGLLGTGLGAGLPTVGGNLPIPAVHTDFPLAALGEELGLVGVLGILGLFLVVVERGLRIAASAADEFRALLAAGLALVIGTQALIIAAGNLKLIPLTGITLPFVSYGGSSLLVNGIIVGLLLALSDRGVEPPPPPKPRSRLARLTGRVTRLETPASARAPLPPGGGTR